MVSPVGGRRVLPVSGQALVLGADLLHEAPLHQVELVLRVLGQLVLDVLHAGSADLVHVADGEGGEGDAVDAGLDGLERHQDRAGLPLVDDLVAEVGGEDPGDGDDHEPEDPLHGVPPPLGDVLEAVQRGVLHVPLADVSHAAGKVVVAAVVAVENGL